MDEAEKVITSIAGCSMQKFFRAPVGMVNFFLDPLLKQRGLRLIGWSARGYDAVESNPSQIIKTIWKDISPGAIVLLHEGHHQAGETNAVNPGVLSLLLEQLAQAGYRCVLPNPTDFLT
jgi:peptidoglycan/xylan/chitin deacetylase (PgdA/CDA1 family)